MNHTINHHCGASRYLGSFIFVPAVIRVKATGTQLDSRVSVPTNKSAQISGSARLPVPADAEQSSNRAGDAAVIGWDGLTPGNYGVLGRIHLQEHSAKYEVIGKVSRCSGLKAAAAILKFFPFGSLTFQPGISSPELLAEFTAAPHVETQCQALSLNQNARRIDDAASCAFHRATSLQNMMKKKKYPLLLGSVPKRE